MFCKNITVYVKHKTYSHFEILSVTMELALLQIL